MRSSAFVVVTLGPTAVVPGTMGKPCLQTAFAITPVDTTGAGDTFCGVLVASVDRNTLLAEALAPGQCSLGASLHKGGRAIGHP
ncbi:MAG: hypothetical protein IPI20_18615 [Rhodoferax sp.]|nr:hypothetical protein [Rhodoferax sp.]